MLHILIIERTPFFRLGVKYFLEKEFSDFYLSDFSTLRECKSFQHFKNPDLILFGVHNELTEKSELLELKNIFNASKFIVYDSEAKAETGIEYLKTGVKGYLSKRCDMTMFRNCIRTVMEDKFYIEPSYIETLMADFSANDKVINNQMRGYNFSLSYRQHEIALLLAQGMSTSEIAIRLSLHPSTISTVKSAIYKKLNINSVIMLNEVLGLGA